DPGNLSAFGLLTVDVKNDFVQTHVVRSDELDRDELHAIYRALETRAAAALDREGFAPEDHRFVRTADLRYDGQAFEVRVPAPDGPIDVAFTQAVVDAFHDEHERLYGYCYRQPPEGARRSEPAGQLPADDHEAPASFGGGGGHQHPVEWVNLRVSGIGPIARPQLRRLGNGDGDPSRARTGTRPVTFEGEPVETPLYARERLLAGDVITGPAIIEEFGSTVPLHPGFTARVDELANLIVTSDQNAGRDGGATAGGAA
ncbi:MAG: hypothetical protein WEB03_16590, partial [Nitriliruptor sp.]